MFLLSPTGSPKGDIGIISVRPSVRPFVRPKPFLRNYWIDFLDTWYDDRPISEDDARHFCFTKKFKMAAKWPIFVQKSTFCYLICWLLHIASSFKVIIGSLTCRFSSCY